MALEVVDVLGGVKRGILGDFVVFSLATILLLLMMKVFCCGLEVVTRLTLSNGDLLLGLIFISRPL